jgi:very-short-patch-repair endonuclease
MACLIKFALYISQDIIQKAASSISQTLQAAFFFICNIVVINMEIINVHSWEEYEALEYSKRVRKDKKKKALSKKDTERLKKLKSSKRRCAARSFSERMRENPSALEIKMQKFLDANGVEYKFQKTFYIKDRSNNVLRFYIADFYIPSKNLIIETDGAFHNNKIKEDERRTRTIQKHYPNVKVIRWKWNDFYSNVKTNELIKIVS